MGWINNCKKVWNLIICLLMLICTGCGISSGPLDTQGLVEPSPSIQSGARATVVDFGFKAKMQAKSAIEDRLPVAQLGGGIGASLFDMQGNSYPDNVLRAGNDIRFFLTLYSYLPRELSYKLIQFVDFNQSAMSIDEKKYDDGYNFTMPPNSIANFPISLNINQKGLHEVLFVFVLSVKDKTLTDEERMSFSKNHLFMYRLFVDVDGENPYQSIQYSSAIVTKKAKYNNILLNKDKEELTVWTTESVKPQTKIPCYLHIGSAKEEGKLQCAVILLNEWKQVDIYDGKKVLFLELEPDMEAIIPTELTMPKEEGVYDVTPIIVYYPYNVEKEGITRTSFRLGVDVSVSGE